MNHNDLIQMKKIINNCLALSILLSCICTGYSQQILLDRPTRAGDLILFPEVQQENNYYYLPDKIALARHEDGNPMFSFIKYVRESEISGGTNAITESDQGGGIVHAVVNLEVPEDMRREAQSRLRRINSNGQIIGPIVYKGGTVSLISSVAGENGEMTQKILGIGTAPILDGQKAAISVQLTKQGADILWATFQTPTPDFSVSFEMEVEGYLSPKRVLIEADFERMYRHQTFEAAVVSPVLAAEINVAMDELRDEGAIKVTQIGEDEQLDQLMQTAYNKLTDLMFDKIGGTGVPQLNEILPNSNKSMLDRATEMLSKARQEVREDNARLAQLRQARMAHDDRVRSQAQQRRTQQFQRNNRQYREPQGNQRREPRDRQGAGGESGNQTNPEQIDGEDIPEDAPLPSLSVAVSYRMKQIKRTGSYRLDLNKYTSDLRVMRFDHNIGSVNCERCFVRVNLDDPLYKQREIHARLDGANAQNFGNYINFVTMILKKEHQNGESTIRELQIDKNKFNESGNDYIVQYGWKGDDDREEWLGYEYKTKWSFFGGIEQETDWKSGEFGSVTLIPPYVRKPIFIEADPALVFDNQVRSVEVKVYYVLGGKENVQTVSLNTTQQEMSKTIEIVLPRDVEDFEYQSTFFVRGQNPKESNRISSKYGQIYLDQLPN